MTIATVCKDCKHITSRTRGGRCPTCWKTWSQRDGQQRRSLPQRGIYADKRWPPASRACLTRHHWTCVDCGRHITELHRHGLRLGAHHIVPVLQCDDPFDVDNLEALCSQCHGRRDGGRA